MVEQGGKEMKKIFTILFGVLMIVALVGTAFAEGQGRPAANRWGNAQEQPSVGELSIGTQTSIFLFSEFDVDNALVLGAEYLRHSQADITEDNAGNGNPDIPDDPDDGG